MDHFETAKKLFFEGLHFLEANDLLAAEARFKQALALVPDRVSILNNLSVVEIRLEKFPEAEELARKAVALDSKSLEAWSNLGNVLTATQRHEEALLAYDRALNCDAAHFKTWLNMAVTLLALQKYDGALVACERALKLNPNEHQIVYTKSLILKELQRTDEALKVYQQSIEMRTAVAPVFSANRQATQKAEVLIINVDPLINDSLMSFDNLQMCIGNFPCQLAERFQKDYHFSFVFQSDVARASAQKQIPQPDFVINNNANGEAVLSKGELAELTKLADSFGVPVVNHPAKVVQTARDVSVKLLENIPGLLVPKTQRFSSVGKTRGELINEIESQYDYPLITRTLTFQKGIGMNKVDSQEMLVQLLASTHCPEEFFVTEFVDRRQKNEFFRKIRAAVVMDDLFIVRADYDTFWKVHGRKNAQRVPFYLGNPHLLEEEKRICTNPEAELGRSAMQALQAMRRQIPLDVFGVDFAVDADGMVVFYEANATMNLFSTAQKEVPNPKVAGENLTLAFKRYFESLLAG